VKIALVTETFFPEINGVSLTFGILSRKLGKRGHTVTVFRPKRSDLPDNSSHPEFHEIQVPGFPIPGYPLLRLGMPAGRRLSVLWRRDRPDIVHIATEGPLGASAVSAARRLGIPVTSSFHTNFHTYAGLYGWGALRSLTIAWLRYVHNRTCRTLAPTAELCTELSALGFAGLGVLSRGIDTHKFSPGLRSAALRARWGAAGDEPVLIHVGRMAPEKNYPLLFRAYEAMRSVEPRLRFVLVGDGPLRRSMEADHPECIFTGFISASDLAQAYASADLYLHPSLTETFGNVLTEALASGLAVVGFDYAAGRECIRHRGNGLLVPCDDPGGFVATAVGLVRDPALQQRLRKAAAASCIERSWDAVVEQFEKELSTAAGLS